MSKIKYRFNPDKLSYDKITLNFWQKAFRGLKFFLILIVLSATFMLIFSLSFDTPGEDIQKRENKQLLFQYELLKQKADNMENSMSEIQQYDDDIYRLIFGVAPASTKAKPSIRELYNKAAHMSNDELLTETSERLERLARSMAAQNETYNDVMLMAQNKKKYLASVPAISPIADYNAKQLAAGFGYRIHPIYRTLKLHSGIDLTAPTGTNVYATGSGRVVNVSHSQNGYGRKVIIDHGYGYKTLYAHLSRTNVKVGQRITRGTLIGEVGTTGRSTAPHLHYEVSKNNKSENPVNYYYADLKPNEYEDMIEAGSRITMSFD